MKNALVTGASGGIGRAVAKELARRGWRVALHYRANEAAAKSLEEAICREGGFARAYPADLTQEAQVEALFGAVERDLGCLLYTSPRCKRPPQCAGGPPS